MRDKKLERQAPLPTRTMRRDGRLIFFSFPLFFFPAPCKLFFPRWIHIQSLSFRLLFCSVVSALPGFIPSFCFVANCTNGQHTFPLFGLLIALSNCPPLISNPSLFFTGKGLTETETNTTTIQPLRKRTVRALSPPPPRQRPPLDKIAYSVLTSKVQLHSHSFSYTLRASPLSCEL